MNGITTELGFIASTATGYGITTELGFIYMGDAPAPGGGNPLVKLAGVFTSKIVEVKLSGTFVTKPLKVKKAGVFV